MYAIGIDVHKNWLYLCVMTADCRVVWRGRLHASRPDEVLAVVRRFAPCRVTFEASGGVAWLIDLLRPEVTEVVLAHPGRLRVISQTVKKTDKIDARTLADLLARDYVPRAYIASDQEREDRALVRSHRYLRRTVRGAKQRVRAALARHNWRLPDGVKLWTRAGRAWLEARPWPACEARELTATLQMLDLAEEQRRQAYREIQQRAAAWPDAARLRTLPHFGPLTALTLLATLGDWRRFSSQREAAAFVGLTPRVDQSAGRCRLGHISGQGNGYLRGLMVEAAWRAIRHDDHLNAVFARIASRRGRKIAIVAVARRLVCIALALLRRGEVFVPQAFAA